MVAFDPPTFQQRKLQRKGSESVVRKSIEKALKLPVVRTMGSIFVVSLVAFLFIAYFFHLKTNAVSELDYTTYDYHIAIISDQTDNSFWEAVYASAQETGADYGAYVEQIDGTLSNALSMEDAINVAIYAGVDGILLRPTEGEVSEDMIERAYDHGIPVVTMQKDLPNANRQGFVGINDYFLGQEYGKQVLKLATQDTQLVMVLVPATTFDATSQSWFQQGLTSTVLQENIAFDFQIIQDDKGLNNAEDIIHSIAEGAIAQPDIILCLDETITLSTSPLVREIGLSDEIQIIGSSVSEAILLEIETGNLNASITIDPTELGSASVEALMTYIHYHMVSYYTEVDTMLIDHDVLLTYGEEAIDD
ncbi:substrate-binding domain-containing protein [Bengtsoniella intestinalis]|uniref:sugar ABC transporter substrate-binding protein n=1 Tax=Bengtsoniella intestinalis TaxID=3073143 RepID=UPI00391FA291